MQGAALLTLRFRVRRPDMLRDLLVHVDGSEGGRRRVKLAIDLAGRTGARVSGLHVTPPAEVQPLYRPSQVGAAVAIAAEQLARYARAAAAIFHEESA
jgi:nucleotide-binding universal stress UspA family protein